MKPEDEEITLSCDLAAQMMQGLYEAKMVLQEMCDGCCLVSVTKAIEGIEKVLKES